MPKEKNKKRSNGKKKVVNALINVCIKIAKQGKGCMFVIKEKPVEYDLLLQQDIEPFPIRENERRLEALALLDGACIIDKQGKLIAYSTKIKNTKAFLGYGTRHSAAYTASLNGNTVIISSEEDRKVRIFRRGSVVMQIDPFEKGIEKKSEEAVNLLESVGAGSIAALGANILFPTIGIAIIPGIIIFGASHYLIKSLFKNKK